MVQYRMKSTDPIDEAEMLRQVRTGLFGTGEVFCREIDAGDKKVYIFCSDDYSFRISSTLSILLVLESGADGWFADAVVSGGKQGLFDIGYGAERSRVNMLTEFLIGYGFTFTD